MAPRSSIALLTHRPCEGCCRWRCAWQRPGVGASSTGTSRQRCASREVSFIQSAKSGTPRMLVDLSQLGTCWSTLATSATAVEESQSKARSLPGKVWTSWSMRCVAVLPTQEPPELWSEAAHSHTLAHTRPEPTRKPFRAPNVGLECMTAKRHLPPPPRFLLAGRVFAAYGESREMVICNSFR